VVFVTLTQKNLTIALFSYAPGRKYIECLMEAAYAVGSTAVKAASLIFGENSSTHLVKEKPK